MALRRRRYPLAPDGLYPRAHEDPAPVDGPPPRSYAPRHLAPDDDHTVAGSSGHPIADTASAGRLPWQAMIARFKGRGYRQASQLNGHQLAEWLRQDNPDLDDVELALVLLSWLDFADLIATQSPGPEVTLLALSEAAQVAALELAGHAGDGKE